MKHSIEEIEKMLSDLNTDPKTIDGLEVLNKFCGSSYEIISDLVEELKKWKELHLDNNQAAVAQTNLIINLNQENKRLREALEFYANTEHIDLPTEGIDDGSGILYFQVEGINVENGIKARKALEGK